MATGTGNLPNPGMSFTPFDILTAAEQNDLVENIESLATGSGIGDGAIGTSDLANAAVTADKIDSATLAIGNYTTSEVATSYTWTDGKTIYKKTILDSRTYTASTAIPHGITGLTQVIDFKFFLNTGGSTTPAGYYSSSTNFTSAFADSTSIQVILGSSRTGAGSSWCTIWYTK